MKTRKPRSDRSQILYCVTCETGQRYFGITVAKKRAYKKSINDRWKWHVNAASNGRDCTLSRWIRRLGPQAFTIEQVEVIRGRKKALVKESQLIKTLDPDFDLNDQGLRSRKHRLTFALKVTSYVPALLP